MCNNDYGSGERGLNNPNKAISESDGIEKVFVILTQSGSNLMVQNNPFFLFR
jgi:hypothetical protein